MQVKDRSLPNAGGVLEGHSSVKPPTVDVDPTRGESSEPEHSREAILKNRDDAHYDSSRSRTTGVVATLDHKFGKVTGPAVSNPEQAGSARFGNVNEVRPAATKAIPPRDRTMAARPVVATPENQRSRVPDEAA